MRSEKMKNNKIYFLILIVTAVLIPLAVAGSLKYNIISLDKIYSGGEFVRGTIKFNFTDYPAHTNLRSGWDSSMPLIDLIRASGVSSPAYNCSTQNCSIPYVRNNALSSIDVRDGLGLVGLTLSGSNINSIRDAQIKITSSVAPSCSAPTYIVLGDNENNVTILPTAYKDVSCSAPQQGCFESGAGNYLNHIILLKNSRTSIKYLIHQQNSLV